MANSRPPDSVTPSDVAESAKRAAHDAVANPWVVRFLRFGHIARGVLYVVIGLLALRLSGGIRDEAMTQQGALAVIEQQPFGHVLLVAIAVGLASYGLWCLIRAIADPNHEGRSRAGIMKRVAFAVASLLYAGLAVVTIMFIVGPRPGSGTSYDVVAWVLARPFGPVLVGVAGLAWTVIVLIEVVRAWRCRFERNLELDCRSRAERSLAKTLGRVGLTTLNLVFAIIGVFLVASAVHANPHHVAGIDGALLALARQPFGRTLLAAAGLGLATFGVFSIMCARWMRIGRSQNAAARSR